MTKPRPPICFRCKGPREFSTRYRGLCRHCSSVCPVCEEFPRARGPKRTASYCTTCANLLQQAALCTPEGKRRLQIRNRRRREDGPQLELLRAARARAKKKSLAFNLELSDIELPAKCPVLGLEFKLGTRGSHEQAYSLDRFIPELGYIKGNVRVISSRANTLKRDASVGELELIIKYMRGEL